MTDQEKFDAIKAYTTKLREAIVRLGFKSCAIYAIYQDEDPNDEDGGTIHIQGSIGGTMSDSDITNIGHQISVFNQESFIDKDITV